MVSYLRTVNVQKTIELTITAGGLISGRLRQGWRVFCQSRQMGEMPLVKAKAAYV
jgi:hypothetical protein